MTISVVALNTLVGVDELLHGSAHLRGWGQDASVDRRLLFVTGFDPASRTFHYRVNQHFGAASAPSIRSGSRSWSACKRESP